MNAHHLAHAAARRRPADLLAEATDRRRRAQAVRSPRAAGRFRLLVALAAACGLA